MKTRNKIMSVALILFTVFIFSLTFYPYVSSDEQKQYSIPLTDIDLYLQDNGTLHVKETFHYSFSGTCYQIYKRMPLTGNQQFQNLKVSTQGAYYTLNQITGEAFAINLYSDPQKTMFISNKDVNVTLEYDLLNVIRFYNDTTELQYKMAENPWREDIGKFNINVHFKSSNGVQYWLNPPYYVENSGWNGNTLQIVTQTIPSGDFFEVSAVIPRSQFAVNPTNGVIINQNNLSEIEKVQNDYQNPIIFKMNFYVVLAVLILFGSCIPLFYLCYGRAPKMDYSAKYETDLPTDDPPAIVNAICGPGISKKIGEPDIDGFKATIMDLIDRNYLLLSNKTSGGEYNSPGSLFLEINHDYDPDTLWNFETEVLNFLREYEQNGIISMDLVSESLNYYDSAKFFESTYLNWKKEVKQAVMDGNFKEASYPKGNIYLKVFGLLSLFVAPAAFFSTFGDPIPMAHYVLILTIVLGIMGIFSIILPQKIAGQWTAYGREYYARWHSFKKYIEDYSLIKEDPPESVNIWNKYLVYATALGVAEGVRKAMKLSIPDDLLEENDMYSFYDYDTPASSSGNETDDADEC